MSSIIVKNVAWRQTSNEIIIHVPLNGCIKNVDLVITNNYVKANCPPCILELFLYTKIVENESKCIIYDGKVFFILKKAEYGVRWPSLELNVLSKKDKQKLRELVWVCRQSTILNCTKNRAEKRNSLQKEAVKSQINIDSTTLDVIKKIRDECQQSIKQNLNDWSVELESSFNTQRGITEMKSSSAVNKKTFGNKENKRELKYEEQSKNDAQKTVERTRYLLNGEVTELNSPSSNAMNVTQGMTITTGVQNLTLNVQKCQYSYLNKNLYLINSIGTVHTMPRKQGVITMKFSERAFPTPARESSSNIEQEWLMKQVEARRNLSATAETFRGHENDPQWLKDKGDEFFRAGNYLAAVSAYTFGIRFNSKMLSLHLNRSATYYALGNYNECVKDCSNALKLMEPKCEANRKSRAKCYARRGVSLCKLRAFQQGLVNLETAFELSRFDESVKNDLLKARQFFSSNKPHSCTI